MRRNSIIALLLTAALVLAVAGCSAARKPAPEPQPKTYVVPEVTTVNYDPVKLDDCPGVVREVARSIRDREATTWVQSGNNAYILASTGKNNNSNLLEVEDILQRVPEQNVNWLDVKMKYTKRESGDSGDDSNITVVRADVKDPPEGVGFEINREQKAGGTAAQTPAQTPAAPAKQVPQTAKQPRPTNQGVASEGAVITQPAPNQEITSPVKVAGNVKAPADRLRLRIMTKSGQIMKETEISPPASGGNFETSVDYNPPSLPRPGVVEIIGIDGNGGDRLLARVPVMIK